MLKKNCTEKFIKLQSQRLHIFCFITPLFHHVLTESTFSKNVEFIHEGKNPAKLEHLKQLYNLDSQSPIRLVPKWSDDHFLFPRSKKMKVNLACHTFSHTAAVALKTCVAEKQLAVEALDTSLFVETVNNMWDLVNSNTIEDPLLKTAINKKDFDVQEQSFEKFQSFIESYKFLNNKRKPVTLPCHRGWLITLRALKQLCETLIKDEKLLNFWCLRKFNQDHVDSRKHPQ